MSTIFPDTSIESERILIDLLSNATPYRKIQLVIKLNQNVRDLALCEIHKLCPDAEEPEIRRHLADLILGTELAQRAYGPKQKELGHGT